MLAQAADLKPAMVEAFDGYIRKAEARMEVRNKAHTMWATDSADRARALRAGDIIAEPLIGKGDAELAGALVHDWIGAVFVPGATLAQTLARVQDYNRNKETHRPEVIDSKLLSRSGDDFHIFLRLMK